MCDGRASAVRDRGRAVALEVGDGSSNTLAMVAGSPSGVLRVRLNDREIKTGELTRVVAWVRLTVDTRPHTISWLTRAAFDRARRDELTEGAPPKVLWFVDLGVALTPGAIYLLHDIVS